MPKRRTVSWKLNERRMPRSARAHCSSAVFRVHWDRRCTIPLSRLASKLESRSDNISRFCLRLWNMVERTTRTCFQWQSAWINEIFSERNLKMKFAGFAKSPQIGALWHFWTLTNLWQARSSRTYRRQSCSVLHSEGLCSWLRSSLRDCRLPIQVWQLLSSRGWWWHQHPRWYTWYWLENSNRTC